MTQKRFKIAASDRSRKNKNTISQGVSFSWCEARLPDSTWGAAASTLLCPGSSEPRQAHMGQVIEIACELQIPHLYNEDCRFHFMELEMKADKTCGD